MKLTKRMYFDAAHQLPDSPQLTTKRCARPHGHTYALDVEIYGNLHPTAGMIVDFGLLNQVVEKYDHIDLNYVLDVPTAENILLMLKREFDDLLDAWDCDARISSMRLAEGYKGEERSTWVIL